MGRHKSTSLKIKLVSAKKKAKAAPRWVDLKKFGLARARFRSIRRFRRRKWRRGAIQP